MQGNTEPTYRNDIPRNSTFVTVTREMLQTEPDLWYDPKRRKYVLTYTEEDSTGKKYRRKISTGTDNKQQAKVFRVAWLEKQAEQGSKVANPFSVSSALNEVFKSKQESEHLKTKTCKETERSIRYFVNFIHTETKEEHYPILKIGFEHCNSFLRSIKSPRQKNKHRANLSALWNTLLDFRETYGILENPFARTKKVKLPDSEPEQITYTEFRLLYEGMRTDTFQMKMYKLACAFSYYTGLRLAEVCFIRTKHTIGKDIKIRNYIDHEIKNKQSREVPNTAKVSEILQHIFTLKSQHKSQKVRETEYLFCTNKGDVFGEEGAYLSKYFTENRMRILPNSVKVTFHSLRRSYGQNLLDNDVPIAKVSFLLGHCSIAVTEKSYANARKIKLESFRELVNSIHLQNAPLERPTYQTPETEQSRIDSLVISSYGISVGV